MYLMYLRGYIILFGIYMMWSLLNMRHYIVSSGVPYLNCVSARLAVHARCRLRVTSREKAFVKFQQPQEEVV